MKIALRLPLNNLKTKNEQATAILSLEGCFTTLTLNTTLIRLETSDL